MTSTGSPARRPLRVKDLLGGNDSNVAYYGRRHVEVRDQGFEGRRVVVGGSSDVKETVAPIARIQWFCVGSFDSEIEATSAGEQAYDRELFAHLSPQSASRAAVLGMSPSVQYRPSESLTSRRHSKTDIDTVDKPTKGQSVTDEIANRLIPEVYDLRDRDDVHGIVCDAIEHSGGTLIYASEPARAPIYLGVQLDTEERIGMLVYPFRMNRKQIKNRPANEVRGQLRYGGREDLGSRPSNRCGHRWRGRDAAPRRRRGTRGLHGPRPIVV